MLGAAGWLSRPAKRIGCLQPGQGVGRVGGSEASKSRMLVSTRTGRSSSRGASSQFVCRGIWMNDSLRGDAVLAEVEKHFRLCFLGEQGFTSVLTDGARMTADCVTLTRSLAATTRMTRSTAVCPLVPGRRMGILTQGLSRSAVDQPTQVGLRP